MPSLANRIRELKQQRMELVEENRNVLDDFYEHRSDGARWEDSEKHAEYERRFERIEELNGDIERLERQLEQERSSLEDPTDGEPGARGGAGGRAGTEPPGGGGTDRELPPLYEGRSDRELSATERRAVQVYQSFARSLFREGGSLEGADPEAYRTAFRSYLAHGLEMPSEADRRELTVGSDPEGGFTVPAQFVAQLIQAVDDMVFVRRFANVIPVTTGDSLGAPSLESNPSDADWTSEVATGSEDTAMDFGKRELHPHPLAKRIKVSRKLLRTSAIGIEALVLDRLGYKFGISEEKGFLTGSGASQPLGLFTASPDGISTARDVSADNTATGITFDGLKNAKWSLKGGYLANARWMFHRDALKQIDKLRSESGGAGTGMYLWQPSTQAGEPDRILNLPFAMSEYVPNTFTTGKYVGILGDFRWYWIADALNMSVQRLVELYAEANKVGFIGRLEVDGMPVLEEAFVRVTLG